MVAGEHRAVRAQEREVERGLHRLGRLVHHREREAAPRERRGVERGERREHHVGAVEHLRLGAGLERARLGEERPRVAPLLARAR